MSVYRLSDYLFVCEPVTGLGGCGSELIVDQARDTRAAAERAKAVGWWVSPPSHWDDERVWSALCGYCANQRKATIAAAQAKRAAADQS